MLDNDVNDMPSRSDEPSSSVSGYLNSAEQAAEQGNLMLALHLYLAAFERGRAAEGDVPSEAAIAGLKRAWRLACTLKERSIAEYVFERMEPFLSSDEVAACADQLQELALAKLEEFGLSRDELEGMTDMLSQDMMGEGVPRVLRVEHLTAQGAPGGADKPEGGAADEASAPDPSVDAAGEQPVAAGPASPEKPQMPAGKPAPAAASAQPMLAPIEYLTYKELVGYDEAVTFGALDFGLGMQKDPEFQQLVRQLNVRHGLDRMPACRRAAHPSAQRARTPTSFMMATCGELGLPVHASMRMEENMQGMPVLCVMAQADRQPKLNAGAQRLRGRRRCSCIEDIDLWAAPPFDQPEDIGGLIMSALSRGAREAVNLIRSSADDPDVFVLCTSAAAVTMIDPYLLRSAGAAVSAVDIDYPTREGACRHLDGDRTRASVRARRRTASELVQRSAQGMPRFDMHMAAREAIEEAYKDRPHQAALHAGDYGQPVR